MRRAALLTGVAATFVATLSLVGCSSGGDDGDGSTDDSPSSPAVSAPPTGGSKTVDLSGSWKNDAQTGDSDLRILTITRHKAMLTGKTTCAGSIADADEGIRLNLTCPDGDDDFASGTAKAADDGSLTVSWDSGDKDRFTKAEGTPSTLPSGADDLPSKAPSSAPDLDG